MTEEIRAERHPGTATATALRGAGWFAGLPMAPVALRFASKRHAGQYREIDHAPFIAHPIEVAQLLQRDGQPDEIIAAGLLHDVLEKTATTSAELRRRFGFDIALLVESVSDDPSLGDYESRKRELRDRVVHADAGTRALFAADKIAKVRELAMLPAWQLNEPNNRAKLAHYPCQPRDAPASWREPLPRRSPRSRAQPTPCLRHHQSPQRRLGSAGPGGLLTARFIPPRGRSR